MMHARFWAALPYFAAFPAFAQTSSGLQLKPPADSSIWLAGLQSLGIGALLLIIIAAALFWLRRRNIAPFTVGKKHDPFVIHIHRISPKTSLMIVRWKGQDYFLIESGQAAQLVDVKPVEDESK